MDPFDARSAQESLFAQAHKKKTRKTLRRKLVILAIVLALLAFLVYSCVKDQRGLAFTAVASQDSKAQSGVDSSTKSTEAAAGTSASKGEAESSFCVVYITGAVKMPGLVTLASTKRVGEALQEAGGFAENAAREAINLAAPLLDGMHIHIPTVEEFSRLGAASLTPSDQSSAASAGSSQQGTASSVKVNINTADAAALQALDGIGPATAQKIIDYRSAHGSFKSKEEIKNVSGIGDKKYEAIAGRIVV